MKTNIYISITDCLSDGTTKMRQFQTSSFEEAEQKLRQFKEEAEKEAKEQKGEVPF